MYAERGFVGRVRKWDINSFYPWLMSHKNVPVGQPTFEHLDALPEERCEQEVQAAATSGALQKGKHQKVGFGFRTGDIRWSAKGYKIKNILLQPVWPVHGKGPSKG